MSARRKSSVQEVRLLSRTDKGNGITEENYSDGDTRFEGPGDGILWILKSGGSVAVWREKQGDREILEILPAVKKNMPDRPLTFGDVANYKEEARVLLEAFRVGDAALFRAVGDLLKPRKAALKKAYEHAKARMEKDDEVLTSITRAASTAKGIPSFSAVQRDFRKSFNSKEGTTQLKKKLKLRGFGWLCHG